MSRRACGNERIPLFLSILAEGVIWVGIYNQASLNIDQRTTVLGNPSLVKSGAPGPCCSKPD